ncbi:hypothetical protein EVAR_77213_1 [Eumeta japonica]|uniref:Uncharacterized protein n=1 Tax=Eumeta variegata TaxID=151549 RepID=A0A4C1T326_EUMVA|nr:hypothetical protein EVAR_77213_1 [Eumeta japonica]
MRCEQLQRSILLATLRLTGLDLKPSPLAQCDPGADDRRQRRDDTPGVDGLTCSDTRTERYTRLQLRTCRSIRPWSGWNLVPPGTKAAPATTQPPIAVNFHAFPAPPLMDHRFHC